jgi:membrane protein DedA with SNARE-associated domain
LALVCLLLFAEEAGLPLPVAPGEAVLIGAGLLIASGAVPAWLALPLLYASVLAGSLTGFGWARAIGPARLRRLAERVHASGPFDRVAARLVGAGAPQIAATRLVPGLRIYTTLVAGAVGVPVPRFLLAVLPAIAAWVLGFTLLGVFVGLPAERLLGRFEAVALRLVLVLGLLAVAYRVLSRMPSRAGLPRPDPRVPRWRLALAAAVDLALVAGVMVALGLLTGLQNLEPTSLASTFAVAGIISLIYLAVARRSVGVTAGEALLRVRYP